MALKVIHDSFFLLAASLFMSHVVFSYTPSRLQDGELLYNF